LGRSRPSRTLPAQKSGGRITRRSAISITRREVTRNRRVGSESAKRRRSSSISMRGTTTRRLGGSRRRIRSQRLDKGRTGMPIRSTTRLTSWIRLDSNRRTMDSKPTFITAAAIPIAEEGVESTGLECFKP
jgi:hypothetical protein